MLAHVAETLRVIPSMAGCLQDGPWHYLDLASAILYGAALVCAFALKIAAKNR